MTNKGIKLWNRAKTIIPGGNQLLSKRAERFLPGLWPSYFKKAKGCEIWDLDGKHYYDFSMMGIGCCILGYADDDVNNAVINAINHGTTSTLNCYEEIELAEKLLGFHSWADMVRFSRTGGEACAIAIRIARAATNRDKVAFCGYHGWHDWYISANLSNESNLNSQLLPGLNPKGIPRGLRGTALPFNYNRIEELKLITDKYKNEIGVIIMEPSRDVEPQVGFLGAVREIANNVGAVLIFDEVTSGFRANIGGIHLTYGIEPDIAVFGKALGNGFPISAVIGRREIMDSAQDTFISSTNWTERIGFVSALATLEKMEKENVPEKLIYFGNKIIDGWKSLREKHDVDIIIKGFPSHINLVFNYENQLAIETLYTQEMIEKGFLASTQIYPTYAYSDDIIDEYMSCSDSVILRIKNALNLGKIETLLKNKKRNPNFTRLTG